MSKTSVGARQPYCTPKILVECTTWNLNLKWNITCIDFNVTNEIFISKTCKLQFCDKRVMLKSQKFDMMANVSKLSWASRINSFSRLHIHSKNVAKILTIEPNHRFILDWGPKLARFYLQISMQLLNDKYDSKPGIVTVLIVKFLHTSI